LNLNYVTTVEHDIDKLFAIGFIKLVEETTWLSPIVVVPKKNKIEIKFNVPIKKNPYLLPFTDEVINFVIEHEVYTFLNGFSRYHHISITLEDQYKIAFVTDWGTFVWVVMAFGVKNEPPTYQKVVTKAFCEYIDVFMKIFLDDFIIFSYMSNHI